MRPHAVGARSKGDKPTVPCPPASHSCCLMASAPCPKPGGGGKSQRLACWELRFPSLQPFPAAVSPLPEPARWWGAESSPCPSCCCLPRGVLGLFHQPARRTACLPWACSPHWSRGGGLSIPRGSLWGGEDGGAAQPAPGASSAPWMLCVPHACPLPPSPLCGLG